MILIEDVYFIRIIRTWRENRAVGTELNDPGSSMFVCSICKSAYFLFHTGHLPYHHMPCMTLRNSYHRSPTPLTTRPPRHRMPGSDPYHYSPQEILMQAPILQFSPSDRASNLTLLLQSEGLKDLTETHLRIHEFSIQTDKEDEGASSGTDPFDMETRELLLLALYLYRFSGSTKRNFRMKKYLVDTVIAYYGRNKCLQALGSPGSLAGNRLQYPLLSRLLAQEASVAITMA